MNSSERVARWLALAAAIAFSSGAAAQQAAGRVLVAVGTVTIERAGARIAGAAGTEVQKGDTIQVGPQSNAQIRLADEAIIALRADTTFRITEFNFTSGGGEKDNAFFSLLKGGIRTVTGLIGKSDPNAYRVDTPTSTIGIRGTHYTLRVCNDDCVETTTTAHAPMLPIYLAAASLAVSDAGPLAQLAQANTPVPNGTYGSVTEGRITVSNQSGVREFGADQYFRVASRTSPPQQLIGPPSFLRDRLEGRGRAKQQRTSGQRQGGSGGSQQSGSGGSQQSGSGGSQQSGSGGSQQGGSGTTEQGGSSQSSGSTSDSSASASSSSASSTTSSGSETTSTVAPTGTGGGTGDSRVSSSVATTTVPVTPTPTLTVASNQVSTTGPSTVLQVTGSSQNNYYRFAGTGLNIPVQCSAPPCDSVSAADLIVVVNPTNQTARIVLAARSVAGSVLNVSNSYGDFPVTINGSQLVVSGSANAASYPTSQGSFRCNDCGPGNSVSVLLSTTYSVTISGNVATLTFTGSDITGSFSFSAPLTLVTQVPSTVGAIAGRFFGTNGAATVYLQTNSAGQPVFFGEPLLIGNNQVSIAGGSNLTLGSNAALGDLVWGTWTGQATGIDSLYTPFTQGAGSVSPWIVGSQTNTLPSSLGVVSFTPFVSVIGNGVGTTGTLNSANLTADFVNRNVSLSINATNAPGGGTYQMNGNSPFSTINGRFTAGWTSISCTGSCGTGSQNGSFNGFFAGANAAGAGVSFSASSVGAGIVGIVGFKK